eukprot:COSAG01_NODE_62894_length_282_cov_1.065574_1_plen_63_part_10
MRKKSVPRRQQAVHSAQCTCLSRDRRTPYAVRYEYAAVGSGSGRRLNSSPPKHIGGDTLGGGE